MQANLVLESTDTGGKKQTTTITHIRPSEKSHATELAIALNALTTNTYVGSKVNEINVDITGKQTPTLTVGELQYYSSGYYVAEYTYTGDGQLFINCTNPAQFSTQDGKAVIKVTGNTPISGTVYATETEQYYSASTSFARS